MCDTDAHANPCLVLEVGNHAAKFSPSPQGDEPPFRLGKDDANDFVHGSELTSRSHAVIRCQHKDFFLVDCSTNGTYVQTEDEQVIHVHRDKVKLWGAGWISLGEPLHVGNPIHFRQG